MTPNFENKTNLKSDVVGNPIVFVTAKPLPVSLDRETMSCLTLALSHAGPTTLHSILSSTTDRLSAATDLLEAENEHLRSLLALQGAIAAQYEEDLSAKEAYVELLSIKIKHAEKTAERSRREAEKDNVPLANVQDVPEDDGSRSAHTSILLSNAEVAALEISHSNVSLFPDQPLKKCISRFAI